MRSNLGDIVPLNIPPGAAVTYLPGSWVAGPTGDWYWTGQTAPEINIPVSTVPGVPPNSGWYVLPDNSLVWTGPGTQPRMLPATVIPPGASTAPISPGGAQGPLLNWTPQAILPDSVLPPSLQRSNPLIRQGNWTPNRYDFEIRMRAKKWSWVVAHGGIKSCCRIPELGAPVYDDPPFEVMPSNGEPWQEMNALATDLISSDGGTAPFNGVNTVILQFQVPNGYDGVINKFVGQTTATGYSDFSNAIVWRLQYGIRYAKNLGNLQNTYGSLQTALLVPGVNIIRVISGQTITVFASIPAGSPVSGGVVSAGVFGWFYPRR